MQAEGIRVDEIDMSLPGACYYLYWEPGARAHPTRVESIRGIGRDMGWTVYAAAAGGGACRLLFGTVEANLDAGLARLLPGRLRHRLYLAQPDTALQPAARYIRSPRRPDAALPEIHYGLFMGGRSWAERMLNLLLERSAQSGLPEAAGRSLAEIAEAHGDRRRAIAEAYRSGGFNLKDIAEHFNMHFSEVSAVINAL